MQIKVFFNYFCLIKVRVLSKKQIFGILFTFLYAVAMLRPLLPVLIYYANYDYIATELCVNKDKPYLECNGKCYLEALQKSANLPTEQQPISTINMMDYPISTLDFDCYKAPQNTITIKSLTPKYCKNFILQGYITDIFHPPELLS